MGYITTHEKMVLLALIIGFILFITATVLLYAQYSSVYYTITCIMMTMIVLFFMLPDEFQAWKFCNPKIEVPTKSAGALFTKEMIQGINWKAIFIVGEKNN